MHAKTTFVSFYNAASLTFNESVRSTARAVNVARRRQSCPRDYINSLNLLIQIS